MKPQRSKVFKITVLLIVFILIVSVRIIISYLFHPETLFQHLFISFMGLNLYLAFLMLSYQYYNKEYTPTILELSNLLIFQWLFVRLTRVESRMPRKETLEYENKTWYSLMYWIVPLTGWNGDYKLLGERKFTRVSKVWIE